MNYVFHPGWNSLARVFSALTLPIVTILCITAPSTIPLFLVLSLLSTLFIWHLLAVSVNVSDGQLSIKTHSCCFRDRLKNIETGLSSSINYKHHQKLGLKRHCLGANIEGYRVGWFTLNSGDIAFACLIGTERARLLTTRDGCQVLLTPSIARELESFLT